MKLTTLTVTNIDPSIIDGLLEAGVAVAPDNGNLIVESRYADTVKSVLNIHGCEITRQSRLEGALSSMAERYKLDEFIRFESEEEKSPKVEELAGRKKIISFIQRKIRETQKARSKKRAQHVRDEMTGRVRAYEEILRRVKAAK